MPKPPPGPVRTEARTLTAEILGDPHNGKEPWRFPDPVTGARIGGQVAFVRSCLRYKRVVAPWGRRASKTTSRPFLYNAEAGITPGRYTVGFLTANHVKAWEMAQFCRDQFGGFVREFVGEPESQNRYLELHAILPEKSDFTWELDDPIIGPRIRAGIGKNEGARIYFWSGQHPHYQAIQGFPFRFDRISIDEAQQIHPGVTRIVNPMLLDSGGALDVTGIADVDAIGNQWFEEYFDRAKEPDHQKRWFSLNFPTYSNPHLDPEALKEIEDDLLTSDDYEQYILAKFIGGSGAVFKNLDAVFTLKPIFTRERDRDAPLPPWMGPLYTQTHSTSTCAWVYEADARSGHTYGVTVDFAGRTRTRDATVISVLDLTENAQVACVQIRDMPSPDQLVWIEGVKKHYDAQELHGDNTPEGAALMSYLRERHGTGIIGHNFSASNKPTYVRRLQFLFEMAEIRLMDFKAQREEFRIYKRIVEESKSGKDQPVSYSHPPNKHDDFVSAILQIAPRMAHGKRPVASADPLPAPMLDEKDHATTTLERFADGAPLPWDDYVAGDGMTWNSVVLPKRG